MLSVRLLGEVTVTVDGSPAPQMPGRQQALIARLALAEARPVPVDQLIDDLWNRHSPASAANALQVLVSGVRKILGQRSIRTVGRTYAIDGETTIDVVRFEQALRVGMAAAAEDRPDADALLTNALGLWPGYLAGGLEGFDFIHGHHVRLEGLYLDGVEAWATRQIRQGKGRDVVSTLSDLVAAHPFREGLRARLVLALAAGGRRIEALAAYDQARLDLVEGFGVDPSEELQAAHSSVLRDEVPISQPPSESRHIRLGADMPGTRLIGRNAEIALLRGLCDEQDIRLISVIGPGGVGKTRLVQEVVLAQPDSATFISLLPAQQPGDVPSTIALSLGLDIASEPAESAVLSAVANYPHELLLVLDNFEHVLPAAGFVAELLAQARMLTVLTTSRSPLGLVGEQRFPLTPLSTRPEVEAGGICAGTALFFERMRLLDPTFVPSGMNVTDAHAIVGMCDGLPLAIEIAAARTGVYSLAELRQRLREPLAVLVRPASGNARGSSVRASIAWSVDALPLAVARTLEASTVFRGGFTVPALCGVAELDEETTVDHLQVLLNHSLLRAFTSGDHRRFDMLEVVREVVIERQTRVDRSRLERRHAQYFRTFLGPVPDARTSPDTYAQLDAIQTERSNLRAAVRYAATDNTALLADLVISLGGPWRYLGPLEEIRTWLGDLLARSDLDPNRRIDAITQLLAIAERTGDADFSKLISEGKSLASQADTGRRYMLAAVEAIHQLNNASDPDVTVIDLYDPNAGELDDGNQSPHLRYSIAIERGTATFAAGDFLATVRHWRKALDITVAAGLEILSAHAAHNLTEALLSAAYDAEPPDLAAERAREVFAITRAALLRVPDTDRETRGSLLSNQATALLLLGEHELAQEAQLAAIQLLHDGGNMRDAIEGLMRLASIHADLDAGSSLAATLLGTYEGARTQLGVTGQPLQTQMISRYFSSDEADAARASCRNAELKALQVGSKVALESALADLLEKASGPGAR